MSDSTLDSQLSTLDRGSDATFGCGGAALCPWILRSQPPPFPPHPPPPPNIAPSPAPRAGEWDGGEGSRSRGRGQLTHDLVDQLDVALCLGRRADVAGHDEEPRAALVGDQLRDGSIVVALDQQHLHPLRLHPLDELRQVSRIRRDAWPVLDVADLLEPEPPRHVRPALVIGDDLEPFERRGLRG